MIVVFPTIKSLSEQKKTSLLKTDIHSMNEFVLITKWQQLLSPPNNYSFIKFYGKLQYKFLLLLIGGVTIAFPNFKKTSKTFYNFFIY